MFLEVSFLCAQVTSILYPSCYQAKWVEKYEQQEHHKRDTEHPMVSTERLITGPQY